MQGRMLVCKLSNIALHTAPVLPYAVTPEDCNTAHTASDHHAPHDHMQQNTLHPSPNVSRALM